MKQTNLYLVYMHTNTINNKKYIGITGNSTVRRWQNGKGYKNNQYFFAAITKYGWNTFIHEILYENLTLNEAQKLEKKLIDQFDTTNPNHGYNIVYGGGGTPKYRTVEEKQAAKKLQSHQSYLRKIADPEKHAKHVASSKASHKRQYEKPEKYAEHLSKLKEIRVKIKELRHTLKELLQASPEIFSEEDRQFISGYQPNGQYICNSSKQLAEILAKVSGGTANEN